MQAIRSSDNQSLKKRFLLVCVLAVFCRACLAQSDPLVDYTHFDPIVDVVDLIEKYYVTETEVPELVVGAINGMLHELDPYSEYIPGKDLEEFQKHTSGSYEGIGIGIDVKGEYIVVISPFEDSPAYRAGILPGDVITEVDGRSAKGWSATRAVQNLSGPSGTTVTLKVIHHDGTEETLSITRQKIHVPTVRGWRRRPSDGGWDYLLDSEQGIGYLRISQFTADTVAELDKAVEKLQGQDMQALILDLRSNPGGLMPAAIAMVDRMIDHGVIVSTRGAHSREDMTYAEAEGTYPRFHLVVLIDQGSASASEIVAGALQDHGRAVIVGQRSWGKGSVQRMIRLPESGAALKLTTDYYYLPSGRCVHKLPGATEWGVTPDIEESLDIEKLESLRDLMEQLTITPLSSAKSPSVENSEEEPSLLPSSEAVEAETEAFVQESESEELAEELLGLDGQLGQAVKQCLGLIRTRPPLSSLSETFGQEAGEENP